MEPEPTQASSDDTVARGVKLALILHVMGFTLVVLGITLFTWVSGTSEGFPGTLMIVALNFGWTQLPYMLPAGIVLHMRRERSTRDGLLMVAGIGFLITSGCWGMVAFGFVL